MNKFKMIGLAMLMAVMFLFIMSGVVAMQSQPGKNKITICHKPGTPAEETMNVPPTAWEENGHSTHGDYIGECRPQEEPTTVPTIVGPPPTPIQATATSEPVVIPPTPTNVPQETQPIVVVFPTETPTQQVIPTSTPLEQPVTIQVSPTITPTIVWEWNPPEPAETCDLCNAQESALEADARLKNTVADFIDMIIDGWIPEVVKFWKE
jgi:hypothetical protein